MDRSADACNVSSGVEANKCEQFDISSDKEPPDDANAQTQTEAPNMTQTETTALAEKMKQIESKLAELTVEILRFPFFESLNTFSENKRQVIIPW